MAHRIEEARTQNHIPRQSQTVPVNTLCKSLENYSSEKLLKRLQNDSVKEHVSFLKVDHDKLDAISFWLVYNSDVSVNNASAQTYTIGSKYKYQKAALLLRSSILPAYKDSKSLPWPLTLDDMNLSCDSLLPSDLIRFLSVAMSRKEDTDTSEKMK